MGAQLLELVFEREPPAVRCTCVLCGKSFDDPPHLHEPRVLAICPRCGQRRQAMVPGYGHLWPDALGYSPLSSRQLFATQGMQLAIVLAALEDECKSI